MTNLVYIAGPMESGGGICGGWRDWRQFYVIDTDYTSLQYVQTAIKNEVVTEPGTYLVKTQHAGDVAAVVVEQDPPVPVKPVLRVKR